MVLCKVLRRKQTGGSVWAALHPEGARTEDGRKRMIYPASDIYVPILDLLAIAAAIQKMRRSRPLQLCTRASQLMRRVHVCGRLTVYRPSCSCKLGSKCQELAKATLKHARQQQQFATIGRAPSLASASFGLFHTLSKAGVLHITVVRPILVYHDAHWFEAYNPS